MATEGGSEFNDRGGWQVRSGRCECNLELAPTMPSVPWTRCTTEKTYCCSSRSSPYSRYWVSVKSSPRSTTVKASLSFSSSKVRRLRISNSEGPDSSTIKRSRNSAYLDVPDEGLKYGLGCSRSSSHASIFVVHESRMSSGMSVQRAANSSS